MMENHIKDHSTFSFAFIKSNVMFKITLAPSEREKHHPDYHSYKENTSMKLMTLFFDPTW